MAAYFLSPKLQASHTIEVEAAREVIKTVYEEDALGAPTFLPWSYLANPVEAKKLEGANHTFVVVPLKEDTGDIHSLVIWKRPKGSLD